MIFISWRYGLRACTVGRYLGYSKILSVVDRNLLFPDQYSTKLKTMVRHA